MKTLSHSQISSFSIILKEAKKDKISGEKVLEVRVVRLTFEPSHVFFFKQPGMNRYFDKIRQKFLRFENIFFMMNSYNRARVEKVGSLSARAKMAIQIFVKHIFTIFATNVSFLHIFANSNQ